MAILNVTLDSLKFANTDGFLRDFGTKKTRDQNGGSLTTRECNENVAKIFDTQRPFYVSEDSETSNIEFSATFVISNGVKLTLGEGSFPGVEVKILSGDNSAVIADGKEYILPLNSFTKFFWTGTSWNYTSFSPTQNSVESINPNDEFPIMQDGETKKVKFQTLKRGLNTYSTNEQVIGTWIDGSLLYRIVLIGSFATKGQTWVDTGITISSVNRCISCWASRLGDKAVIPQLSVRVKDDHVQYWVAEPWVGTDCLIIEYTKK